MPQIAIIIRHGESEANAQGIISEDFDKYPLTNLGKEQARKTGENMVQFGPIIDGVYSSPVIRAKQTAQEFLKGMKLDREIKVLDGLKETYFGKNNNVPVSQFPPYHKERYGIEPFEDNGNRILKTISGRDGINLYFSHMLPIKSTVCNIFNLEEEDASSIFIKNASMTIVDPEKRIVYSVGSLQLSDKLKNILLSFNK